jgi:hypothetical protein
MNQPFRRRGPRAPTLSPDQGKRRGQAAQAALGSVDAVRAFLNSHHDVLAGRPIAIAGEAGLIAIEAAVAAEGRRRPRGEAGARR